MKQILSILLALCFYIACGAQATSLVIDNQTPGWLSSKINYGDQQTLENLTVTGYINKDDLSFIGDLMSKHNLWGHLDLTDAEVVDIEFANSPSSVGTLSLFKLNKKVSINRFSIPKTLPSISPYLLAYVEADTIDYGSSHCKVLSTFIVSTSYTTNICPKVLILRDGVSKIEKFGSSDNLQKVILPQSIESIGYKAFVKCTNLSSINLPNSIHTIDNYAFANTSILPDTLNLPQNLKIYHTRSFPKNPGQTIVIPNATEEFDNDDGGEYTLDLHSGIGRYDQYSIIINREQPPRFRASYGPNYVDLSSCILYVPKESISLYQDIKYNSSIYGNAGNPYSYATIFPIAVPIESIGLNYNKYNLNVGNNIDLLVTIQPQNADNPSVTWQSSDVNVAQVTQEGKVTALSSGKAIIKVISNENATIYATCEITVHQPLQSISLNPTEITLTAGEFFDGIRVDYSPNSADNKEVIWSSSNESIVTVDSNGKIFAANGGIAKIRVKSVENNEIHAECTVTVIQPVTGVLIDQSNVEITEDGSIKLNANVVPENATNQKINWMSSDPSIAIVSGDGVVYGLREGTTNIIASTEEGGFIAICKVSVVKGFIPVSEILLNTNKHYGPEQSQFLLEATVLPENASNKVLLWQSSDNSVAMIDNNGLVTLMKEGTVVISASATDNSGVTAECEITVQKTAEIIDIIIESKEVVQIYDLAGNLIYEGLYGDLNLNSGLYIFVTERGIFKMLIK